MAVNNVSFRLINQACFYKTLIYMFVEILELYAPFNTNTIRSERTVVIKSLNTTITSNET